MNSVPTTARTLDSWFKTVTGHKRDFNPVILVGSYTIGKERLAVHIAERLDSRIFAKTPKKRILETLNDENISKRLCDNGWESNVHIVSMSELSQANLEQQWAVLKKRFTHLVALQPSGWNFRPQRIPPGGRRAMTDAPADAPPFTLKELEQCRKIILDKVHILRVPYSEHSSFVDLHKFCVAVPNRRLIPTVNTGSARKRAHMYFWLNQWSAQSLKGL
jgi:DNA cross-link repair 1A protein